jgi:TPP-dependent 2-oxoacid decarboxylase
VPPENRFEEQTVLTGEEASILAVMASMSAMISLIYLGAVGSQPLFGAVGGALSVILGASAAIGALRRRRRVNLFIGAAAVVVGVLVLVVAAVTHL